MASRTKGNSNQNIKVFVRVRPTNSSDQNSRAVVQVKSDKEIAVKDSKQSNTFKTFTFNNVFGPNTAQIDVYRSVVQPLIEEVLSGYNCTVFAYGQTGTGKTFTMEGERSSDMNVSWEQDPLAGVVPRTLSQLFDELRLLQVEFSVKVSFLELYNEELFDLLSPSDDMTKLRIYEDSVNKGAIIVSGLEEVSVHTKGDVYDIMRKGAEKRQTASTLMNARSSRSHTVFSVTIYIKESNEGEVVMRTGKMNLVDLAGSENIGRSGAVNKRAREAGNINQALLTLGRVITALVERSPHIPYRESKLTRILQESLGGRTKTSIIATISPSACNLEETLSTLDYAHRAKNIQNKPEINQRLWKNTLLKECSEEIERLQRDLEATRQRTGVYLAQAEYDDMLVMMEQLTVDAKNKEDELKVLEEELEKKMAICDELSAQTKALEDTVRDRSAVKEEQVAKLSKLKIETSQIVTETSEKDYLMLCHMETLQNLTSQTNNLLKTTVESTKNAELLFDKIDRTRNASQRNETSIQEFARKHTEISNETKDLIPEKVKCLSSAGTAISSSSKRYLTSVQTHQNNAMTAAAEGVSEVQKQGASISQIINDRVTRELELQAEMTQHKEECSKMFSAGTSYYASLVRNALDGAKKSLEEWEDDHFEMESEILSRCKNQDVLQEWSSETSKRFGIAVHAVSEKMDDSMKTLSNDIKNDDFLQIYFDHQELCKEKFEAISKLLSEINASGEGCAAIVEAHRKSVEESINTATSGMEEVKSVLKSTVQKELSLMDSVQTQLFEQLDAVRTNITSSISKVDYKTELMGIETICQQGQNITNSSASFTTIIEDKLRKDVNDYEHLTQLCDSHTKEILKSVNTAGQSVEEHANHYTAEVELLTGSVQRETAGLRDVMQSLELSLKEKIGDYEEAIDDVSSHGAKPATPTGKTPLRSELRIPRDFAATSPHEKILNRLRSKYRAMSEMSLGESPDSVHSDADSDLSVLESDVLANKENSLIDKECSDKSLNSSIPKTRKPLAENN